eukprot:COSAG03_NODE_212_length_10585_cov_5.608812_11_plen_57_part_00
MNRGSMRTTFPMKKKRHHHRKKKKSLHHHLSVSQRRRRSITSMQDVSQSTPQSCRR